MAAGDAGEPASSVDAGGAALAGDAAAGPIEAGPVGTPSPSGSDAGAASGGGDGGGDAARGVFQLFLGQDTGTLAAAQSALAPLAPQGVTLYTNLANVDPTATNPYRVLGGIPRTSANVYTDQGDSNAVDYGAGSIDFKATTTSFPSASLAVGLYLSDASGGCTNQPLRAIVGRTAADTITGAANTDITPELQGEYGYYLQQLAGYFASLGTRTVLLRIGYEFDGPWNCYDPPLYVAAYRTIAAAMRATAPNVKTVWQSAAWSRPGDAGGSSALYDFSAGAAGSSISPSDPTFGQPHLQQWYPGDDVVDLVGLSYFYGTSWMLQWGADGGGAAYPPPSAQEAVVAFAAAHGKSVFLAESAPQGFDLSALTLGTIFNGARGAVSAADIWQDWFVPYFAFLQGHAGVIYGASYIDDDWQAQTQWACAPGAAAGAATCASAYWGDSRVEVDASLRTRFLAAVAGLTN